MWERVQVLKAVHQDPRFSPFLSYTYIYAFAFKVDNCFQQNNNFIYNTGLAQSEHLSQEEGIGPVGPQTNFPAYDKITSSIKSCIPI